MTSKVQPAVNYWTDDVKITSKVQPLQIIEPYLIPRLSLLRTKLKGEERGLSFQTAARFPSFYEHLPNKFRTSTKREWFVHLLKLYLFWFFLPWNMGDQPKTLRRRKKKEVSQFSFPCCIFIARCCPLETDILRPLVIRFNVDADVRWMFDCCSLVRKAAACRNFSWFTVFFLTWIECVQLFLVVLVTRRQSRTHKRRKRSWKVPEMELSFQELNDDERKSGIFHR